MSKNVEGLNKVDVKEEEQSEDKVDEVIKNESSESEEEEDEQEESGRGRFKSERQPSVVSLPSVRGKRDIPETLEISKEAKEKLDAFNRRKEEERHSKRNRRGGRGGRGGPPQRYGHSQRGGYTPHGGNSQRGGFSQHGGPPQRKDTSQYGGPGQRGGYQSQMRFPGPGQSGMRPHQGLRGNQPMRGQHPQQGAQHVPMGMNPTMFGQQEQIRPQIDQQRQRPLLMPRPQMPQQQPPGHQRPRIETSPQTVPQQETPESHQPKKIHINPHFKGAVQVSSHGPTWNNPNLAVSGPATSSPAVPPRMPNQNRPPDQYNRQHVPPSSSWNQAPRLTPAQTWTSSQSGPHPYRDNQPPVSSSQHFSPPPHRGPGPSPQMTQSQNSYPRMQQPQQMQPAIPNRQQQLRPRAAFPHQQPTYPPRQHPGNFSGPPVQNQHQQQRMPSQQGMNQGSSRPRFPGTPQASQSQRGMNPGSARPRFPGTSQNQRGMNPGPAKPMFTGPPQASQHCRQPAPQFRQQTPRLRSPVNRSPGHSPLSPRHSTPQRTDQPPTPKASPQLLAHPQKLIEQASAKSIVQVKEETNEDAETRRLRIQIEEQKKLREEIMKRKEERRQQLAAKRQEALKKRLAEQGHDVAKATKKLGLQPAAEKPPANNVNPVPESAQQHQGSTRKTNEQLQEQFLKQKLNQQRQYHDQVQQQHQPQPMPDGPVKVWKQQQNLKVLVDEPRPIPTVGCPERMVAPQRPSTGSMNRAPNRGRGRGRGRGQCHPYQHAGNPSHQNQQMHGHQIEAQHGPPQQVPAQQFESPVQHPPGNVPQRRPMQQARGGVQGRGSAMGRGRGGYQNVGRGRAQQARRGNMHQVPQPSVGRGMGRVPMQQAPPGNVQAQPAPVRKSVKERLGQLPGASSPQPQNFHEVPGGNQQRLVVPPGQVIQQIVQPLVHPRQILQRPVQPNPMEGARLVKTEPMLNRVLIEGLSASTASQKIVQLTKSVGPLQNIHMIPNQRKAFLTFLNPQHAYVFQSKYDRHMLDLSMLTVKLTPAT
ncbi:RNA-binding protein 33-like [Anneissia japonica]|uniref:RNA-binding protein 33-like n=1 Tax=Anneissia japonica TaxID=1529436 RepID=UPI001425949D|nr:RNA-binding protein 33-like [Anneissia japonica]